MEIEEKHEKDDITTYIRINPTEFMWKLVDTDRQLVKENIRWLREMAARGSKHSASISVIIGMFREREIQLNIMENDAVNLSGPDDVKREWEEYVSRFDVYESLFISVDCFKEKKVRDLAVMMTVLVALMNVSEKMEKAALVEKGLEIMKSTIKANGEASPRHGLFHYMATVH